MKRLALAALALACLAAPSAAASTDSFMLANELGTLLAAEEICELAFDQAAIADFIDAKVEADDLGFGAMLRTQVQGSGIMLKDQTASERTAFCTQQRRAAKALGFVQ